MFLNKKFNGSAFEDIPEEHIGWLVLMSASSLAAVGLMQSLMFVTGLSVLGMLVGAGAIAAAHGFRSGFRAGERYRPVITHGPSIGPP